jgi:hypothetical protein
MSSISKNIQILSIGGMTPWSSEIDEHPGYDLLDQLFATEGPLFPALRSFQAKDLNFDFRLTDMLAHCPLLEAIRYTDCNIEYTGCDDSELGASLLTLLSPLCNLKTIHLSRYGYSESCDYDDPFGINDAHMAQLGANCLDLTVLNVPCGESLTNAGLKQLSSCSRLTTLVLDDMEPDPNDLRHCPITDAGLCHLRGHASLTSISLSHFAHITDAWISSLAGILKCLSLEDCFKVDWEYMETFAMWKVAFPELETMSLSRSITPEGLMKLPEICPRLMKLKLDSLLNTPWLPCGLRAWQFSHLVDLSLVRATMTEKVLTAIGYGCHNLKSLKIDSWYDCTLTGTTNAYFRHLTSLDLSCRKITDASIKALIGRCPSLKMLKLKDKSLERLLTRTGVNALRLARPAVTIACRTTEGEGIPKYVSV